MKALTSPRALSLLTAAALAAGASQTASAASFDDTFDAAGAVADDYTGFELKTGDSVADTDSNTFSNGSSFDLDLATAGGQVDFVIPNETAFNVVNLSRSVDTANHYDLTQATTLTADVSGLDVQFFPGSPPALRNPLAFGFNAGASNPGITASVAYATTDFAGNDSFNVTVQADGVDLPGGRVNYAGEFFSANPNGPAFTLNLDDDSFSVLFGTAVVIADTNHNLVFSATDPAVPFVGGQLVFDGAATNVSVDAFSGTGTTAVPEPATATLAAAGLGLLATRRRRGR